jgi:hypothetical protein
MQLMRQRVQLLKQQLERCIAAHSRLQRQLETERHDADARCAHLQLQVEVKCATLPAWLGI